MQEKSTEKLQLLRTMILQRIQTSVVYFRRFSHAEENWYTRIRISD